MPSTRLAASRTAAKASGMRRPGFQAGLEFLRLAAQLFVAELLEGGFEGVDLGDGAPVRLQQTIIAAAEDFLE
jgi:hypothetical protein